jgi:hypothetical protein
VIPLQIIYSFHDQEREEGASALSFFGSRTPSFLKIAENRKATTPFSLRSTEIFFEAAVVFGSKSCKGSQATTPLPLQPSRILGVAMGGIMWDNYLGSWNCRPFFQSYLFDIVCDFFNLKKRGETYVKI